MNGTIDTDAYSAKLRAKAVRRDSKQILITNFKGTPQELDLQEPPNCDGFGRIRHFRRDSSDRWPSNPLPMDAASKLLGSPFDHGIDAQVFQNAACNWRCWYCFVPYSLLEANESKASWLTADELIDLYLKDGCKSPMIDLTGGQPELTPEWVPWMMEALTRRGLSQKVMLWSDDNLSNDYFWRFLSEDEIERVRAYPLYAKVCCFKGFDAESFAFNTRAAPDLFDRQFELFRRYLALGVELYAYATFTSATDKDVGDKMRRFVDRLQAIHKYLPLRMVPLEIKAFGVVKARKFPAQDAAIDSQWAAIQAWREELSQRFSVSELSMNIAHVSLHQTVLT